jgi:hypothetical protein
MNPYYHSLSYAKTAQQLNALQVWSDGNNFGPDYDSRMRAYLNIEEGNEQEWMDELMVNSLAHFFHCGTENFDAPRGHLNSLMIQCGLLDYLGANFGPTDHEWELSFDERFHLMARVTYVAFLENQQVNANDQGVLSTYADGQDKYDRGTWELLPN